MKLFLVTRWGSDDPPDYIDGPDTNFLVRAGDFQEAARLADGQLERLPHTRVTPFANVVVELGIDSSTSQKATILAGPFVQFCYSGGYQDAAWVRDPFFETVQWQRLSEIDS